MFQTPPSTRRRGPSGWLRRMSASSSNSTSAPRLSPATWPRRQPWARARRPASASARPFSSRAGKPSPSRSCAFIPSVCHGRDRNTRATASRPPKAHTHRLLAVGLVGHLAALLVQQRRPGPAQEGVAGGVVPGRGPVERDGRRGLSRRHQRQAVRDAGHRPEAGGGDAGEVARGVRVPRARHEDDVALGRARPAGSGATGRPLRVSGPQPSAQAKRSPSSSGIREGEDDAERAAPRPAAGRSRPRCPAGP